MSKLKRLVLVLIILIAAFVVYVEIANRNSKNMTYKQKVLKAVYPAWMWWTKMVGKNRTSLSSDKPAPVSFYSLNSILNNGEQFPFDKLKGKKVLLVNTASNCGYTNQYEELEKLSQRFAGKLVVLGFPANDFKEQEKGSDEEIAQFCKLNFGVSFPLMKKSVVVKKPEQNPVYKWLTQAAQNGWNEKAPSWNFSKYLVSEEGALIDYFDPSISPLSDKVVKAIEQ